MPAPLAHILNPVNVSPHQATGQSMNAEGQGPGETTASLVSNKRVLKACTQCRRDKSRCDKARPCYSCVRKGRSDTCIDGCVACRQARLSCDESRPCNSCIQFGCTCIEDDLTIIATRKKQKLPPSMLLAPRKIRPQPRIKIPTTQPRPELECISCQRHNEKCTGGVTCRRCEEFGEQCMYGSRLSIFTKQRCAQCRKKNKRCERIRPCVHCVKADVPCVDLPRKSIGVGLRVKRACAGCRADKTQCEEARPCGACKKKDMDCVERACNTCFMKESKCAYCTREDQIHKEECENSSTASYSEEENDNVSSLVSPSSASSQSCNALSSDPSCAGKLKSPLSPHDGSESRYAVTLSKRLESLHRLPSFDTFDPYYKHLNHLAASPRPLDQRLFPTLQTSKTKLPSFSDGFSSPSLAASTSHMQTRPSSDRSKD